MTAIECSNYAWHANIKVVAGEDGESIEIPKENDGTVLLSNIQKQFAKTVIGLKYKGPSGAWRAVREGKDGELLAPKRGWDNNVYHVTFLRKRKSCQILRRDNSSSHMESKPDDYLLKDLAVIRLPYEADREDISKYFDEKYGGVANFVVKTDDRTGKSMGYGFIRFDNEESARKAIECEDDEFMGWKMSVKTKFKTKPMKMFVNSLPEGTTTEDLVEYFSQFGKVIDSCVPQPFRSFGFFTFASTDDGDACLRQRHTLKSHRITVRKRTEAGSVQDIGRSRFGKFATGNYGGVSNFSGGQGGFGGGLGGFSKIGDGFDGGRGGFAGGHGGFSGGQGDFSGGQNRWV